MIDIEQKNFDGKTALHEACFKINLEIIEYLLSKGANPNIKNSYNTHESVLKMLERWLADFASTNSPRNPKDKIEKAIELLKRYGAK